MKATLMRKLSVKSPAFENGKFIPAKYTCDGNDVNPPLAIDEVSKETKTLMLIADDPDAPMGTWNHWVVWNIPENRRQIAENTVPGT